MPEKQKGVALSKSRKHTVAVFTVLYLNRITLQALYGLLWKLERATNFRRKHCLFSMLGHPIGQMLQIGGQFKLIQNTSQCEVSSCGHSRLCDAS